MNREGKRLSSFYTFKKLLQEGKIGNEWWYINFLHRLIYKDDEGDDKT